MNIVFIDEAGFYLLPGRVRTYAPSGETPILKVYDTYTHLSVMSGITMRGEIYKLVRSKALSSKESVRFLKHLKYCIGEKLMIIWDGSPIHRKEVTTFMTTPDAYGIEIEWLPPYAPDLNPTEGVWQYLKRVELRNVTCKDMENLRNELRLAIMRLRSKPEIIQAFFSEAGLVL